MVSHRMLGARRRYTFHCVIGALLILAGLMTASSSKAATPDGNPYTTTPVADTNPDPGIVETTLTADEATVDIGNGNGKTTRMQAFNGSVPGPTFRLEVGDTVIVHYRNRLEHDSAIHWHGIELPNAMDGTPFTQNQVKPGGRFLYRFQVTRPGIYWYHPHHHSSNNQVFKGLYGMMVVKDPNEAALQQSGTLPPESQTKQVVLSDVTVCKNPGANDAQTYSPSSPHVSGSPLPAQPPPTPRDLCETSPVDEDGALRSPYVAGEVPAIQQAASKGDSNEGQTVLTNGVNAGFRSGSPDAPGGVFPSAKRLDVPADSGLRLQLLNASTTRYFRLRLTTGTGAQVRLLRVGGEGGLLDRARVEGGIVSTGLPYDHDTRYGRGEILLAPGNRADVVMRMGPTDGKGAPGLYTLWTQDLLRTRMGFAGLPTVAVMHFNVTAPPPATYSIQEGAPLRAATGDLVERLDRTSTQLPNPATEFAKPGLKSAVIGLTLAPPGSKGFGVDGHFGTHEVAGEYSDAPHLGSSRYIRTGDTVEMLVRNQTGTRHPFHLHGFSIQPISLESDGFQRYIWDYHEFVDTVDVPAGYSLRFRVRIDERRLGDGRTSGGELGRWVMHCHIFFHAESGMLSELVVVKPGSGGNERPDVNVDKPLVEGIRGKTATNSGTVSDRDSDAVSVVATDVGTGAVIGTVTKLNSRVYTWRYAMPANDHDRFVAITATDMFGYRSQMVFFLKAKSAPKQATLAQPGGASSPFDAFAAALPVPALSLAGGR